MQRPWQAASGPEARSSASCNDPHVMGTGVRVLDRHQPAIVGPASYGARHGLLKPGVEVQCALTGNLSTASHDHFPSRALNGLADESSGRREREIGARD